MNIQHHGAVNGVTGSCHQLHINPQNSILIDCGLFQGNEKGPVNNLDEIEAHLVIEFDITTVQALIVTHCHIDHVGRIPYLLAAGFRGAIYATEATAALLPLVIEDALKVGVTRNQSIISACLTLLKNQLVPLKYKQWQIIKLNDKLSEANTKVKIKLQPAGHILGSAYVEVDTQTTQIIKAKTATKIAKHRIVFSGDLGAPYAPLLPAPKSPYRADTLVIESTYGDKNHQHRKDRTKQLQQIIEKAVVDNGVVLIPAFSIGRTQELLYELEKIIHQQQKNQQKHNNMWESIDVIVDSPMAAKFTEQYKNFKSLWDNEAKREVKSGRHPLNFEQLYTVDSHQEHIRTIEYLLKSRSFANVKPAIVIAASGMCSGGRIVNYLKAFLSNKSTDILFVGYQAQGTLGRSIQKYGAMSDRQGYVFIERERIDIKAKVHTLSGYSAHADQKGLINFVKRMRHQPTHIKIVHGDENAKQTLADKYHQILPDAKIEIPH
jgi:metallo-beta-lactamase family protein